MQDALIHIAAAAGREIIDVYESGFDVQTKDDAAIHGAAPPAPCRPSPKPARP